MKTFLFVCYLQFNFLCTITVLVYSCHGQAYTSASEKDFSLLRLVITEFV